MKHILYELRLLLFQYITSLALPFIPKKTPEGQKILKAYHLYLKALMTIYESDNI